MSEVYLQFDHPCLVTGSPGSTQIVESAMNAIFSIAQHSNCNQSAMELFNQYTSIAVDFLELNDEYSLSLRLYDNAEDALAWINNIQVPPNDNIYSAFGEIYSNMQKLRCEAIVMFLGVPCNTKDMHCFIDDARIDWKAYCCIISEF